MSPLCRPINALFQSSLLNLLLLFPIFINVARCAVISTDSLLLPKSHNLSANPDTANFHCVHTPQWRDTRAFDINDCFGAFYMMQYMEGVDPYEPEMRREFKTRSAPSLLPAGDSVLTPRKYVTGQRGGIAVALWGTGSSIDKDYQNLRPIIALPSLPRPNVLKETA
ncbi:MAG: hypothetical protein L6R42_007933 [Xanthoria sp. 1 TBL-2021]|nr:MAG: hypothetical protein L6R42_007933 [Xanthoria sp. 1 TBL-2021]